MADGATRAEGVKDYELLGEKFKIDAHRNVDAALIKRMEEDAKIKRMAKQGKLAEFIAGGGRMSDDSDERE